MIELGASEIPLNGSAVERFAWWHDQSDLRPPTYGELLPASMPSEGQQYAFEVNLDRCSGCKACVTACHNLNGLDTNETWRKIGWLTGLSDNLPIVQHVTTACHHCVEPSCLSGCPVKAYEKDPLTGIVKHLDDQCFGCKYCIMMCPYEVPQFNASLGIVRKCDMCSQRLTAGEAPACVQACPHIAIRITIVEQDACRTRASSTSGLITSAPHSSLTVPSTLYHGMHRAQDIELHSEEERQLQREHSHWPLVWMLVLTQASVGLWCVATALSMCGLSSQRTMLISQVTAFCLAGLGVHVALLHLGRPWLAMRGVLGWRTSWLSREVICFSAYLQCAASAIAWGYFGHEFWLGSSLMIGTALVGVVALYCSAMVYVATRRSLWSGMRLTCEFAGTACSLGAIAWWGIYQVTQASSSDQLGTPFWLLATLSIGGACLAVCPKWLDWRRAEHTEQSAFVDQQNERLNQSHSFSLRSGQLLKRDFGASWRFSWVLMAFASVCVSVLAMRQTATLPVLISVAGSLGLFLLLVRWHAFATVVFRRMPGASS